MKTRRSPSPWFLALSLVAVVVVAPFALSRLRRWRERKAPATAALRDVEWPCIYPGCNRLPERGRMCCQEHDALAVRNFTRTGHAVPFGDPDHD